MPQVSLFRVPVPARPVTFTIPLAGVTYTWRTYWLVPMQCWVVNIADSSGNPLIQGVPLLPGTNLLGQFGYIGPDGALIVHSDADPDAVPDWTHLGITSHVLFYSFANPSITV